MLRKPWILGLISFVVWEITIFVKFLHFNLSIYFSYLFAAQGGEGGGHTGDVATSILIPKVVDLCRGRVSPLSGKPVYVVAAGGIFDGRGLAMALALGAQAVWVGTRFVCAKEAGAPASHQPAILGADYHD